MDRTYLLDEITKIRRVIIEKSGKFTLKECESIAAALEITLSPVPKRIPTVFWRGAVHWRPWKLSKNRI